MALTPRPIRCMWATLWRLCLMKRLQMAGNKPIAVIGGGTAMVGDPSGRTDMRQMATVETIARNGECFKKQMSKFIDFSEGKAIMVNNDEWLMDLNYVEFLRMSGRIFPSIQCFGPNATSSAWKRGCPF